MNAQTQEIANIDINNNTKKTVGFVSFEQFHQKKDTASSRIRVNWLLKYMPEAELFCQGKDYDVVVYQKAYWKEHMRNFQGKKILDICVSGNSLVMTEDGWKFAKEIKINDKLLTHNGRFKKVKKVYQHKGNLGGIKVVGLPEVKLTDNHPIMNYKYNYKNKDLFLNNYKNIGELNEFDRHSGGDLTVSLGKREINENSLSEDMGWFWGYYSAEGSRNIDKISFTMHSQEKEQRNKIMSIIDIILNKKARYRESEKDNKGDVLFNDRKLSRYVKENIKSHLDKTVIPDIFSASIKTKLSFIEGYISGDGYCDDYNGISVSSVSKKLAYSVWLLFRDCGINAMMNYHKRDGESCCFVHKNGKRYDGNPCWRIQLNPKESIKFVELTNIRKYKKTKIDYWKSLKSSNTEIKKDKNYLLHPIKKIKKGYTTETVYNFEVEEDNTYIVDGIITHNCDPDWLDGLELVNLSQDIDVFTVPTEPLKQEIERMTKKSVYIIPDRMDLDTLTLPAKEHTETAKSVVWFGYSHNMDVLDIVTLKLKKMGLKLIVVSDGNYNTTECEVQNIKWEKDTANINIQKGDIALLPEIKSGRYIYKSNNKTVLAWSLGLPVAKTQEELERFVSPQERQKEVIIRLEEVKKNYDVKQSVRELREVIENIKK